MAALTGALWALSALMVYVTLSLRVGDVFPFSKYSMYARLRERVEGAVLFVTYDGVEVAPTALTDFVGLEPAKISAAGFPCSQEWVVHETRRWVEDHLGATGPDHRRVELGFRIIRMEAYKLTERREVLTSGAARRRR